MKTSILILSFLLIFYGCDLTDNSSNSSTQTHTTWSNDGIEFSLDIPKNSFLLNDTLSISFAVKNFSNYNKEFNFSNIQQLGYQIINNNNNNVATYFPIVVAPALSHFSLEPGKNKVLDQIGLFKDINGNYIKRGDYSLFVFLLDNNSPKLKLQISVN